MAGKQTGPEPTSERVAANLKRIRQERGLGYAELSRRLAVTGHPILDTGLMKIEKGQRRVDVDDLMALAVALDVTPARLLLPDISASPREAVTVTPGSPEVRAGDAWAWAQGERPLGEHPASLVDEDAAREELAFVTRNRRPDTLDGFTVLDGGQAQDLGVRAQGSGLITAAVLSAYTRFGMDTREIRAAVESALLSALTEDKASASRQDVLEVLGWIVAAAREGNPEGEN